MILAIDQGTTGTTCLVFDADARVVGRAYSEFEQRFPRPGWVEHDPNEIWDVTRRVAGEALAAAGIAGRHLDATAGAAFGTIDAWLTFKLPGRHVTDLSNASRTMLFDIHRLTWDPELCELLGVDPRALPEPARSAEVYGTTSAFGGDVPVAGIAGDQQAALFGQACHRPGMAKNTYGTGSFVLLNTGTEAPQPGDGLLTTIAWGLAGETDYALEAAVFVTGAAVQWLRDGVGLIESASETEELAGSLKANDGVYFVPA